MTTQELLNQAVGHHQSGRLAEAETLYRQVLADEPDQPDALHLLGLVVRIRGQTNTAIELIGRAATLHPSPQYLQSLAEALAAAGRAEEAVAAMGQAIALSPGSAELYFAQGNLLFNLSRLAEAEAAYRQAIALRPNYARALNNLANTLNQLGRPAEAIPLCNRAIELRPDYASAWNNLGNAHEKLAQFDAAFLAYRRAVELNPDDSDAWQNVGGIVKRELAVNPNNADIWANLAAIHKQLGRLDEAIEAYDRSLALRSDPITHSGKVMLTMVHPRYDAAAIHRETLRWNELYAAPLAKFVLPHDNDRSPGRKLRIGYVSPDFCKHVLADNILPLFRTHDRSGFSVYCYGSVIKPDTVTEEFRALSDGYRDIRGVDDSAVCEMIRADRIDILVDLNLHMKGNRLTLFARKPAPVQIAFAGYPGSTGVKAIDYRLTDPYLDLPGQFDEFYSERSIRLAHSFWCFVPNPEAPPVGPLPALSNGYVNFGSLNLFIKITDETLALWSKVLRAVDRSRLLLMAPTGFVRQRLLSKLAALGVSGDRVTLVERQPVLKYLKTYDRIDVVLDSVPYNGHTTSLDAFWMGVPLVTLVGRTIVGRGGLSQLTNIGLPELVAVTEEQFVEVAASLAGDLPRLAELRRTLRARMLASPLTDAAGFARTIEDAYRQVWSNWLEGG